MPIGAILDDSLHLVGNTLLFGPDIDGTVRLALQVDEVADAIVLDRLATCVDERWLDSLTATRRCRAFFGN